VGEKKKRFFTPISKKYDTVFNVNKEKVTEIKDKGKPK